MSAPVLLDTCAAMFFMAREAMTTAAVEAIDKAADLSEPLYVSPITAWEVGMMTNKSRFKSSLTPQRWFELLRTRPGIALCELTADVLLQSWFLPGRFHRDPADRIIAATAREFGYTVMTRDRALLDYAAEGYLRAVEC